uniref:homocysteine-responsive endoplasmic reticulum-resident ubiquitin-like domain member 1 protein n=1 Tax=Gasterosteus aculeatus aculeatus TaxID=481459 RepID=UPI001A9825B8|nr:homocysteine-responsive endoplasmic reticulum-resident ubiquitin-like domain member 1 protein [Gasterosteus aculeatus aculeatus]
MPLLVPIRTLQRHLCKLTETFFYFLQAVSDQRLIHAGKLLPDHLHIKDLFRQADGVPTLHLVCPPQRPLGARPKSSVSTHSNSPLQTRDYGAVCASADAGAPPSTVQTPELRQRRPTSSSHAHVPESPPGPAAAAAMPGAPPMVQPAFPTYSLYSPQQLLWLQQVYARQYYMQYHAALAAAASPPPAATLGQYPPVPAHQVPLPDPLANQNPMNNLPANQNLVQEGAFINPGGGDQNLRMNAQGGPVMDEEEDVDRDWLDWLYSATRVCVLLLIVYFNSSPSRFLLVTGAFVLMYLHTVGWFPFRGRAEVQGPNHPQPPGVQRNQQNDDRNPNPVEEDGDREAAAGDGSDGEGPMRAAPVPPYPASVVWTLWVFLKTFFSSLLPELPQVPN